MVNYFNFVFLRKLKSKNMLCYVLTDDKKNNILSLNFCFSFLCCIFVVMFFLTFMSLFYKSCLKKAIIEISGQKNECYIDKLFKDISYSELLLNFLIVLSLILSDYIWLIPTEWGFAIIQTK